MIKTSFGPFFNVGAPDWIIKVNKANCKVNKEFSMALSPVIKKFVNAQSPTVQNSINPDFDSFQDKKMGLTSSTIYDTDPPLCFVDVQYQPDHPEIVSRLFNGKEVKFTHENEDFLMYLAQTLKISSLKKSLEIFIKYENCQIAKNLEKLGRLISNFNNDTYDDLLNELQDHLKDDGALFVSFVVFNGCICRPSQMELYLNLVNELNILNDFITVCIYNYKHKTNFQESFFLIRSILKQTDLSDSNENKSLLFGDLFYQHRNKYVKCDDDDESQGKIAVKKIFSTHFNTIQMKAFDLHNDYAIQGINPDQIALAIRNDRSDLLIQNLGNKLLLNTIPSNYTIKPSLYERSTIINNSNEEIFPLGHIIAVPLICYAAYFGSIECFKVLIDQFHVAIPKSLTRYAICGGNREIFDFCYERRSVVKSEQGEIVNDLLFDNLMPTDEGNEEKAICIFDQRCLELSVIFQRFDFFKLLVEDLQFPITQHICDLSIQYFSFEIFVYIVGKAEKDLNLMFLNSTKLSNDGAGSLLSLFAENFSVVDEDSGKTPLHFSCENGLPKVTQFLFEKAKLLNNKSERNTEEILPLDSPPNKKDIIDDLNQVFNDDNQEVVNDENELNHNEIEIEQVQQQNEKENQEVVNDENESNPNEIEIEQVQQQNEKENQEVVNDENELNHNEIEIKQVQQQNENEDEYRDEVAKEIMKQEIEAEIEIEAALSNQIDDPNLNNSDVVNALISNEEKVLDQIENEIQNLQQNLTQNQSENLPEDDSTEKVIQHLVDEIIQNDKHVKVKFNISQPQNETSFDDNLRIANDLINNVFESTTQNDVDVEVIEEEESDSDSQVPEIFHNEEEDVQNEEEIQIVQNEEEDIQIVQNEEEIQIVQNEEEDVQNEEEIQIVQNEEEDVQNEEEIQIAQNEEEIQIVQNEEEETPIAQNEEEIQIVQNEEEEETPIVQNEEEEVQTVQNEEEEVQTVQNEEEIQIAQNEEDIRIVQNEEEEETPIVQNEEEEVQTVQNEEEVQTVQNEEEEVQTVQNEEEIQIAQNEEDIRIVQNEEEETPIAQNEEEIQIVQNEEEDIQIVQNEEEETPIAQNEEEENQNVQNEEEDVQIVQNEEEDVQIAQNEEEEENVQTVQNEEETPIVQNEEEETPIAQNEEEEVQPVQIAQNEEETPIVQNEEEENQNVQNEEEEVQTVQIVQNEEDINENAQQLPTFAEENNSNPIVDDQEPEDFSNNEEDISELIDTINSPTDNENLISMSSSETSDDENNISVLTNLVLDTSNLNTRSIQLPSPTKQQIDVNAKDEYGITPLQLACREGRLNIVQLIIKMDIDHEIDYDSVSEFGKTAIQFAEEKGHKDIVELLNEMNMNENDFSK